MTELVKNCPRCRANQITFEVLSSTEIKRDPGNVYTYEVFAKCRNFERTSVFVVRTDPRDRWGDGQGGPMYVQVLNNHYDIIGVDP